MNALTSGRLEPADYLERIRFTGAVSRAAPQPSLELLRGLHAAHLLAVPFENLSIHYGQPIILREDLLYDKIVRQRRGGFCYELNGLFVWLLLQFGFTASRLSAEVAQADGGFTPAFDHMAIRVHALEGADWLADVGFGDSFRQPLRLQSDVEQDGGDSYLYRLQLDTSAYRWLLQRRGESDESEWESQYRFSLMPHPLVDFAGRCVFQQTSPDSHFTQRRICTLALPNGRITLSDLRLITTLDGRRQERVLRSEEEYRAELAERFGIRLPDQPDMAAGDTVTNRAQASEE